MSGIPPKQEFYYIKTQMEYSSRAWSVPFVKPNAQSMLLMWDGFIVVFADRWQQLLARSLHGAHIPPDHGFLQPVHLHERPESGE